jgi:hypothetical protein
MGEKKSNSPSIQDGPRRFREFCDRLERLVSRPCPPQGDLTRRQQRLHLPADAPGALPCLERAGGIGQHKGRQPPGVHGRAGPPPQVGQPDDRIERQRPRMGLAGLGQGIEQNTKQMRFVSFNQP